MLFHRSVRVGPGYSGACGLVMGGFPWVLGMKSSVAASSCSVHKTEEELQAILAAKEEKPCSRLRDRT